MDLTNLSTIRHLLSKHKTAAEKSLGQNFLTNQTAIESIIKASNINEIDHVVEVGPGLGVLTKALAQKAKQVTSIEIDDALLPILAETLSDYPNLEIIHGDALQWIPNFSEPYKLTANIPYYITSPLINHFINLDHPPTSISLLVQKEVAEKICAPQPDSILPLQVALHGQATYITTIPKTHFHPAPKVDSAIIHITLHTPAEKIPAEQIAKILKLAKQAYSQKRKKLRNTLPAIKEKLEALELGEKRPEHLTIADWLKLI